MVDYPEKSKCRIPELPDYTVYVFQVEYNNGETECYRRTQSGEAKISFYWPWPCLQEGLHLMRRHVEADYYGIQVKGVTPEPGSNIMLDTSCKVPSTLLKKYNVVTSVSTEAPEYIVFPDRIDIAQHGPARFYVNEAEKVVIALIANFYDFMYTLSDEDYLPSLHNALAMVMPEIHRFAPMHLHPNTCISYCNDQSYMYAEGLIPKAHIVNETDLFIGETAVNYDIIKSCYQMLQSTDNEMRLAALYSLAQQDCHGYKEILRWIFQVNRGAVQLACSMNKPMRWLRYFVTNYRQSNNLDNFTERTSLNTARRLITDLTEGNVHWDHDQLVHNVGYSIKDSDLARLVVLANK